MRFLLECEHNRDELLKPLGHESGRPLIPWHSSPFLFLAWSAVGHLRLLLHHNTDDRFTLMNRHLPTRLVGLISAKSGHEQTQQ
jgi:hypothetical protein